MKTRAETSIGREELENVVIKDKPKAKKIKKAKKK